MARFESGALGNVRGKVGRVVVTTWKGKPVVRAAPPKRSGPAKGKEKQNQSKFSMAHFWLKPLLEYVREGYKGYSEFVEGFNAAKSQLLNHAFEGEQPNIYINPEKVKLSSGDLPLPTNIKAAIATEQSREGATSIEFTWDTTHRSEGDDYWDQVMVVAKYVDVKEPTSYTNLHGQFRGVGSHILDVEKGYNYNLYLAFTSKDRSRRSDSVYLGEVSA